MFKKIKSLFILEEEGTQKDSQQSSFDKAQDDNKEDNSKPGSTILSEARPVDGAPDPKFVDVLLKALEAANKEGFDYLEYKTSLQSLQKMDMDERTRFQSAFVMAKTLGLTKEKLVSSTEHYVNVLKNEEKKFKDALVNQKAKQVEGREAQLKSLEQSLAEKIAMIEKLKAEIDSTNNKMASVKNEINESVLRIDQTNDQFMHAYQSVLVQITDDMSKIKTYIE